MFSTVNKKVAEFCKKNPDKKVIRLGIGDVTKPLCKSVIEAMHKAVDEMGTQEGFHGYGPEQGYDFLREKIQNYYKNFNVNLDLNEIFISDGAKSDVGNILNLFSNENKVLIPDPVYPAYVDTNTMDGREIIYIKASKENDFLPVPNDSIKADMAYICSPNNPTGAVYDKEQLAQWVKWAIKNKAIIIFDAAYECFIDRDSSLPKSIFEIEGARKCAIEICSLSKTAGFTGTRCGYTIVPNDLEFSDMSLNKMWLRRQTTKFNGTAYIIQRGAEAVFTPEGQKEIRENINYYKNNARIMAQTLDKHNIYYTGGINSPYIWLKCPNNMGSWEFFDYLLEKIAVVGTPGAGFGKFGEGYLRLTSFGTYEATKEAMERLDKLLS
jgi:LL-diaminopimelate aminotransferase